MYLSLFVYETLPFSFCRNYEGLRCNKLVYAHIIQLHNSGALVRIWSTTFVNGALTLELPESMTFAWVTCCITEDSSGFATFLLWLIGNYSRWNFQNCLFRLQCINTCRQGSPILNKIGNIISDFSRLRQYHFSLKSDELPSSGHIRTDIHGEDNRRLIAAFICDWI